MDEIGSAGEEVSDSEEISDSPDRAGSSDDGDDSPAGELPPLLAVQSLDTELGQLQHRRASLPLRSDLEAASDEWNAHLQLVETTNGQIKKLVIRQRRCEAEAAALAADAEAKDNRLYSGEISVARGLQALKTEIERIRSRQSEFEDQAIEALIEIDDLADKATSLEAEGASLEERVTVLQAELDAALSGIDARIAAASAAREEAAAVLDAEVLDTYKRRRLDFGHCTVVSFDEAKGCDCPSRMPLVEVIRVRNLDPGMVLDCAECGRLVLR